MARRVSSQEVRRLAYKTVESPIGTDLVGVYINSIAKENKRRLTPEEKAIIDWWEYNPEDRVPISVFKFIKKKCYLVEYAQYVREAIVEKLVFRDYECCTEDIIKYASFFNLKTISNLDFLKFENLLILLMAVAVDEFDETGEMIRCDGAADKLERMCMNFRLIGCNEETLMENIVYINAINSVLQVLSSKLNLGD